MTDRPAQFSGWRRVLLGRNPARTAVRASLLALACFALFRYAVRPAWVDGESMEPTVADRGLRFVNLLAYRFCPPARGDIVAIRGASPRLMYLKRVLGLPGERVGFREGRLWIDGAARDEPYVVRGGWWTQEAALLGPDEYFVAGDNREMPMDRHLAGVVRRGHIAGRLLW